MDHLLEIGVLLVIAAVVIYAYLRQNTYASAKQQLQKLQGGYRIRHNVKVLNEKKEPFEIEHVVIGRAGVFVINVEDRAGKMIGEEPDECWIEETRSGREEFENPTRQNLMALRLLRECLNDTDFKVPMYPVVVFGKKADISELFCESAVIKVNTLATFIQKFQEEVLTEAEYNAISKKID